MRVASTNQNHCVRVLDTSSTLVIDELGFPAFESFSHPSDAPWLVWERSIGLDSVPVEERLFHYATRRIDEILSNPEHDSEPDRRLLGALRTLRTLSQTERRRWVPLTWSGMESLLGGPVSGDILPESVDASTPSKRVLELSKAIIALSFPTRFAWAVRNRIERELRSFGRGNKGLTLPDVLAQAAGLDRDWEAEYVRADIRPFVERLDAIAAQLQGTKLGPATQRLRQLFFAPTEGAALWAAYRKLVERRLALLYQVRNVAVHHGGTNEALEQYLAPLARLYLSLVVRYVSKISGVAAESHESFAEVCVRAFVELEILDSKLKDGHVIDFFAEAELREAPFREGRNGA